ncbi:hypothetical protein KJ903_01605 [Patescibacteria group bacterium]|nr:hypothetical protein [Patescibacteria group bacterium]
MSTSTAEKVSEQSTVPVPQPHIHDTDTEPKSPDNPLDGRPVQIFTDKEDHSFVNGE